MERYQRPLLLLLALTVTVPLLCKSRPITSDRDRAALLLSPSVHGYVSISGDVRFPGMYPLRANLLTSDVISMAVPLRPVSMADPDGSDRPPVRNGEALHVRIDRYGKAIVTRGDIPAAERLVMRIPLDISTVSESDLDAVPGIGPALAGRIVRFRQNNGGRMSLQDLLLVEGIGETKYNALKTYF